MDTSTIVVTDEVKKGGYNGMLRKNHKKDVRWFTGKRGTKF